MGGTAKKNSTVFLGASSNESKLAFFCTFRLWDSSRSQRATEEWGANALVWTRFDFRSGSIWEYHFTNRTRERARECDKANLWNEPSQLKRVASVRAGEWSHVDVFYLMECFEKSDSRTSGQFACPDRRTLCKSDSGSLRWIPSSWIRRSIASKRGSQELCSPFLAFSEMVPRFFVPRVPLQSSRLRSIMRPIHFSPPYPSGLFATKALYLSFNSNISHDSAE